MTYDMKIQKKTLAVERHNVGQEDEGVKVQKEDKLKQNMFKIS